MFCQAYFRPKPAGEEGAHFLSHKQPWSADWFKPGAKVGYDVGAESRAGRDFNMNLTNDD